MTLAHNWRDRALCEQSLRVHLTIHVVGDASYWETTHLGLHIMSIGMPTSRLSTGRTDIDRPRADFRLHLALAPPEVFGWS
ncbi:hypothetical protein AMTR_s00029p00128500 [Amborella trichopoda]|uniref:Uncharacterized protein n=1 Tax=Amborella trichopoda TaxID=13333 RepID=W1PQM0_AMBTC|nr:hypothetical protein AMTR_s00029p00128500 [Amborella trichopoda]